MERFDCVFCSRQLDSRWNSLPNSMILNNNDIEAFEAKTKEM